MRSCLKRFTWLVAMMVFFGRLISYAADPVKVAVYRHGFGATAVRTALQKDARFKVSFVKNLAPDELLQYDVLYIGSTSIEQPDQVKGIKVFLNCGGGVILNHVACGRYRPATILPEIVARVGDRRDDSLLRPADGRHPIAADLPQEYEHAFNDHLLLEPGAKGQVVIVDREGAPVVVVGEVGVGRAVFNGSLPGYLYDPTDYSQKEQEPTGAELTWLANAVLWAAGERRLTATPAEEIAARRAAAENDIKWAELAQFLPSTNWFANEMLYGGYLPMPPVTELGGRFFLTYDNQCWRRAKRRDFADEAAFLDFFRKRLRLDVLQLKWMGFTDIIYWVDMGGEEVYRPTEVPDSVVQTQPGLDALAELIRLATPEGVRVWAAWHSCLRSEKAAEKFGARNEKGDFYKYGGRDWVEDLLNPAWGERCRLMLDEYAEKYKPLGNFEGLLTYDELWFTFADFHGAHISAFEKFCLDNFGEKLPADILERMALGSRWKDVNDVWRRRFILFKQKVMTDFFGMLVKHAHKRGLKMGVTTIYLPGKWYFGMDNYALSKLGADYTIGQNFGYPDTLSWTHIYAPWGDYTTSRVQGGPGGLMFTFNHIWRPVVYGNDPAYAQQCARHVYLVRMWANAERLARVAFLQHENAWEMFPPEAAPVVNRHEALVRTAQFCQDVRRLYSQSAELFSQYKVLVASPYAVRGLTADNLAALRKFVEEGGTIVAIDADWSTARPDMTEEVNHNAEFSGVLYTTNTAPMPLEFAWGGQKIQLAQETPRRIAQPGEGVEIVAEFSDGTPAVTERKLGQGKIIAVHFDAGAEIEKTNNKALMTAFNQCLRAAAEPPVVVAARHATTPYAVRSVLRKGNWVAVALYSEIKPVDLKVQVDLAALGLNKKDWRVLLLGKQLELSRPGDFWGGSGFWSAEAIKRGIEVTIVDDQRRYLPLPETFDFTAFSKFDAEYVDKVIRPWWDSEKRGKRKRDYGFELVVIAPADEPGLPPQK